MRENDPNLDLTMRVRRIERRPYSAQLTAGAGFVESEPVAPGYARSVDRVAVSLTVPGTPLFTFSIGRGDGAAVDFRDFLDYQAPGAGAAGAVVAQGSPFVLRAGETIRAAVTGAGAGSEIALIVWARLVELVPVDPGAPAPVVVVGMDLSGAEYQDGEAIEGAVA